MTRTLFQNSTFFLITYIFSIHLIITFRDAIYTHFVTLIGKWTIVGGCVKHRADKRGKVAKLKYKSFVTSLERTDKKTGWMGKKRIVHLPISVTKWVWMASLTNRSLWYKAFKFWSVCLHSMIIALLRPVTTWVCEGVWHTPPLPSPKRQC